MTAAAARRTMKKYMHSDYPPPTYVPRQVESMTEAVVETQPRTDGRRFLLGGVGIVAVVFLYLYLSGNVTTEATVHKAIFEWDNVQYMGVGREYSQVVRGMGPCVKVEQWLEPVVNPESGRTVNILKGVCVEMKHDDNTDATN